MEGKVDYISVAEVTNVWNFLSMVLTCFLHIMLTYIYMYN
jgi:hypothetical protein